MRFSLFRKVPPSSVPGPYLPAQVDLNQALEMVLVSSVKSQAETAAMISRAVTESLVGLSEIQQAVFSHRRIRNGGRKRAQTAVRGGNGRFKSGCRLCQNAQIQNPTIQEIQAHATHESGLSAKAEEIQVRPDGAEVIECADCAASTPGHSHQIH